MLLELVVLLLGLVDHVVSLLQLRLGSVLMYKHTVVFSVFVAARFLKHDRALLMAGKRDEDGLRRLTIVLIALCLTKPLDLVDGKLPATHSLKELTNLFGIAGLIRTRESSYDDVLGAALSFSAI